MMTSDRQPAQQVSDAFKPFLSYFSSIRMYVYVCLCLVCLWDHQCDVCHTTSFWYCLSYAGVGSYFMTGAPNWPGATEIDTDG